MNKQRTFKNAWFYAMLSLPILLIAGLFFATTMKPTDTAYALSFTPPAVLSEMTDKESIEFIIDYGVEVPDDFAGLPELGEFVKSTIEIIEADPYYEFGYSYNVTTDFAESIRAVVNEFYGVGESRSSNQSSPTRYTLADSTLVQYTGWLNYNCYAYSIGRNENPPQYSTVKQYQPGDFSNQYSSNFISKTISQMAGVVKDDLEALGYSDVTLSTSFNVNNLQSHQKLICIRKGLYDYHFMRYDVATDAWYHKPAWTAILKWNYISPGYKAWTNELVNSSGVAQSPTITYDSSIYYITYSVLKTSAAGLPSDEIAITGVVPWNTISGALTIPVSLNGRVVTGIGDNAFKGQTAITAVGMSNHIKRIGDYAFDGCYSLAEINLSSLITGIGNYAFRMCVNLTSINLPISLTAIGNYAFMSCVGLTNIKLYQSPLLTAIGEGAFMNCMGINTNVILPQSVVSIGSAAFSNCGNMVTIIIPGGVTAVGAGAFGDCDKLIILAVPLSQPGGWHTAWNPQSRPVVWGYVY